MSAPVEPEEKQNLVLSRDLISILLLLLGSILITIGTFVAFGWAIGLLVTGILIFVTGVAVGWQR